METPSFETLLKDAVETPGRISQAYSLFHDYSLGNQMLALFQCYQRGIEPGAINTYKGWLALGRHVRKGEKAITLCMPVVSRSKDKEAGELDETGARVFTRFIYRNNWFVVSQTDGLAVVPAPIPSFDLDKALAALNIERVNFGSTDGNTQGYASGRTIAISPLAVMPHKTAFHEIAHVLLGHTNGEQLADSDNTPRSLREVEAESVAMLCVATLGLDGLEYSRGYIQHWLNGSSIPEKSARKIFAVASQILKAGEVEPSPALPLFDGGVA